jgi:hypothetical protein
MPSTSIASVFEYTTCRCLTRDGSVQIAYDSVTATWSHVATGLALGIKAWELCQRHSFVMQLQTIDTLL